MIDKTKIVFLKPQKGLKGVKYILDYDKTYPYFMEHIFSGKCTLYSKIKESIDFKKGEFFTFLTDNAYKERLYELEGGIMPSYPTNNETEREVYTLVDLSFEFVVDFLKKNPACELILDQFILERKDLQLEGVEVVSYGEEIYYILNTHTPTDSIGRSIKKTDHWWYCMGVLTEGLRQPVMSLKEEDLDQICNNLKYIMTTVYDGEGYLFWEKKY